MIPHTGFDWQSGGSGNRRSQAAFRADLRYNLSSHEKLYENALVHERRKSGLAVSQQHPIVVRYDGIVIGEYTAYLLVERTVLVELKAAKALDEIHRAQCLNYLKATGLHLCMLLNFGRPRLEIKRIVLAL